MPISMDQRDAIETQILAATYLRAARAYQEGAAIMWQQLTNPMPQSSRQVELPWGGSIPSPYHWGSQHEDRPLFYFKKTAELYWWANKLTVDWEVLMDEQIRIVPGQIQEMAAVQTLFRDQWLTRVIEAGSGTLPSETFGAPASALDYLAHDGSEHWANDHQIGFSGQQDNLLVGALTDAATAMTSIRSMRKNTRTFKNDQGRPMRIRMNTIMVHPDNEDEVVEALGSAQIIIAGNTDVARTPVNVLANQQWNVISNYFLETAGDWYAFDTRITKPVDLHTHTAMPAPVFIPKDKITDENVLQSRRAMYYVLERFHITRGLPLIGCKVTAS